MVIAYSNMNIQTKKIIEFVILAAVFDSSVITRDWLFAGLSCGFAIFLCWAYAKYDEIIRENDLQ